MKIIDYKIVKSNYIGLAELVKLNIQEGWFVYGFPFVIGESMVGQALIKYDTEEKT